MSRTHRALLLVALAQFAIGAAAVFARFALTASGPLAVSAARLTIGALPLVVLAASRGRLRPVDGPTERRLAVAGLLLAAHFACWIASLDFASVALSTLLVCSSAIWTEAYAVLRRGRIDPYAATSVAGALAGVAIVVGAPDRVNTPLGLGLAIAGTVAIAAYLIVVRDTDPRYDTLAVTSRTYSYAAIALTAAALIAHDHLPPTNDLGAWGGILAMALLSQLFGHTGAQRRGARAQRHFRLDHDVARAGHRRRARRVAVRRTPRPHDRGRRLRHPRGDRRRAARRNSR